MQQQFRDLGFEVAIEDDEAGEEDAAGAIDIMECNWSSLVAFVAFVACSTQWRVVGLQLGMIFIGLDYTACQIVLQRHDASAEVFADIQAMESAALEILNEAE
jgi:hypothetical protein